VFVHRGRYGTRTPPVDKYERPWETVIRNGKRVYRINRGHPVVKLALQTASKNAPEIDALLRVLEETVPVQQIWLDVAEQNIDTARPYDDVDYSLLRADVARAYDFLVKSGINKATAKSRLENIEPYNRFPELIAEL
jgi:hypothetical protein